MAKNIEPLLMTIGQYLKLDEDVFFSIPEYQRPYSWEITQCDKLWQDILDYSEGSKKQNYFFGTIILNCQNNDTDLGLIDGQQRTTTFLLMLKALLIRVNIAIDNTSNDSDSESLCSGLKERRRNIMRILYKAEAEDISNKPDTERDREIIKNTIILENNSINELYKTELKTILNSVDYAEAEANVTKIPRRKYDNKYTRFFRNFKFFYETASGLSDSKLNNISKKITEKCEVIVIKSWQVEQAIDMFNSLNSDGLPLCDSDIISAKLYSVAESKGEREKFTSLWQELNGILDKLKQDGIASIDSILMQQMYIERAKNQNNEIVNENGSIDVTTPGMRRYYTEINSKLIENPIQLCTKMIVRAKIWSIVAKFPVIQTLFKFNDNSKLFLACYFNRFDENDIDIITESTIEEISIFIYLIIKFDFVIKGGEDGGYAVLGFEGWEVYFHSFYYPTR